MSNSTTLLDQIASNQAAKEVVVNALLDAASPATLWGRHASACSGLTWGYYGGNFVDSTGTAHSIANGTVTLTASTTNYLYADPTTGAVSANTSGFPAGKVPLYSIVTGTTTVTSYTDYRSYQPSATAGSGGTPANQSANTVYAGPSTGAPATPTFRALVQADLPAQPYDMLMFFPGVPANGAIMGRVIIPRVVSIASGASGYASAETAATASTTLSITRNGTAIGTVTFGAGSTSGTVSITSTVTTAAGDIIRVVNQATADTTLASISVTLFGTR